VPVWARISFRVGKLRSFQISVGGFAVVALTLLTAAEDRVWLAVAQAALLGFFYAGTQLFPFSMLPDAIDVDTDTTGMSRAGAFTGLWTAGETVGAAAGPAIFAAVLALTGFVESSADEVVEQTATALNGIRWGFAVLPGLLLLASLPIIGRYRIPDRLRT
jgi:Na+/melibiose symporter-like transporter